MKNEPLEQLISLLLEEMPNYQNYVYRFGSDERGRAKLARSLMNLRTPKKASDALLKTQDYYLQNEMKKMGLVDWYSLPVSDYEKIALWRGNIIRLSADAIVNCGNQDMLGCFVPNHNCLDNWIHSYAGVQLRFDCDIEMKKRGRKFNVSDVFMTSGYNLPSKYVLHVLGPTVRGRTSFFEDGQLKKCYFNCLELARLNGFKSLVFPCISTGEQGFPKAKGAKIATETVKEYLMLHPDAPAVVFDVYTDIDETLYKKLLYENL